MENTTNQQVEDEEMLDIADGPSFDGSVADVSMKSAITVKSGRRKIPPKWTRIISMEFDQEKDLQEHSISIDMQLA